jgi:formylglycine-generating enzyme required for sulfatase activity
LFRILLEKVTETKTEFASPLLAKSLIIQTQWPELYQDWLQYPTLVSTLESEYCRQSFYEHETIGDDAAVPAQEGDLKEAPKADGLLESYLCQRREYILLERMLTYPSLDRAAQESEKTHFIHLGRSEIISYIQVLRTTAAQASDIAHFRHLTRAQMAIYLRLAGAVGAEEQMPMKAPADLLTQILSGDQTLIQDAAARLEEEEPDWDGPQHGAFRQRLLQVMRDPSRLAPERVSAGDGLAAIGDSRFREDAWYLPDEALLGFVEIPEGPFMMGTREEKIPQLLERFGGKQEWYEWETPQHQVDLPTYYVARYPVTVAQFRSFVEDSGYEPTDPDSVRGVSNHPVVRVTWHEALKYCEWLTVSLQAWQETPEPLATSLREQGWTITLPSEAEWEKAARGSDERIFPWGEEADSERANFSDTGIWSKSAMGCFPGGASPYGVEDLSGNVWEWCRARWESSYQDHQGNDGSEREAPRVLRGGAFYSDGWLVRCASRCPWDPNDRSGDVGFRVVACPAGGRSPALSDL